MVDLTGKTLDELEAIEKAVKKAREKQAMDGQNDLIRQYQEIRLKLIRGGIVKEDQLPNLKIRGWTRKSSKAES